MENIQVEKLQGEELRELSTLVNDYYRLMQPLMEEQQFALLRSTLSDGLRRSPRAHSTRNIPLANLTLRTACAFAEMVRKGKFQVFGGHIVKFWGQYRQILA